MTTESGVGGERESDSSALVPSVKEEAGVVVPPPSPEAQAVMDMIRRGEAQALPNYLKGQTARTHDFTGIELPGLLQPGIMLRGVIMRFALLTRTDFTGTKFVGSDLYAVVAAQAIWRSVDLTGADLRAAVLTNADLSESKCAGTDFTDATLTGVNFKGAYCVGSIFVGAYLIGIQVDERTNFAGCDFTGAYISPGMDPNAFRGAIMV